MHAATAGWRHLRRGTDAAARTAVVVARSSRSDQRPAPRITRSVGALAADGWADERLAWRSGCAHARAKYRGQALHQSRIVALYWPIWMATELSQPPQSLQGRGERTERPNSLVRSWPTEEVAVSHLKAIRERIERPKSFLSSGREGLAWLMIRPANSPRAVSAAT